MPPHLLDSRTPDGWGYPPADPSRASHGRPLSLRRSDPTSVRNPSAVASTTVAISNFSSSFMYVDDCVEGTVRVASGENALPVDVGSSQRYASIKMVDMIERIAGIAIRRN